MAAKKLSTDEESLGDVEGAAFASQLEQTFPRAVPESVFVDNATAVLNRHGFTSETSINLVSTCRDELCRPFTELLDAKWGDYFNIASLAGFVFCGRTGFKAAMAHAPIINGIERYVFWVCPHIALDSDGSVGKCWRLGRENASSACGALMAVQGEIKSGKVSLRLEHTDMEQSLVKQELLSHLPYGKVPDLVELTYAAYECIVNEVLETAYASINPSMCEFAVVAGIQVHGPRGQNYFWPGTIFKVKGEEHTQIDLYEEYAQSVASWHVELKGWDANESLALLQKRGREARLAVQNGDLKTLKHIGMDLFSVTDNRSRTLLHIAAMHNQVEIVEFLLKKAKPEFVNERDIDRLSAMDYAVQKKFYPLATMLKKAGGGLEGPVLVEALLAALENLDLEEFGLYVEMAKDRQEALTATDRDGRGLVHMVVEIKERQMEKVRKHDEMIRQLLAEDSAPPVDFFGKATQSPALNSLKPAARTPSMTGMTLMTAMTLIPETTKLSDS